jgi:hypothetical protein
MPVSSSQTLWITLGFIGLIVLRFLFRELRERRVRTQIIFLIPGILGAFAIWLAYLTVSIAPTFATSLAISIGCAIVVGIGLGLAIAHFTSVRVGPPGIIYMRGSWITVAIWIVALLLRMVGRFAVTGSATGMTAAVSGAGSAGSPESLMLNTALLVLLCAATATVRVRVLLAAQNARTAMIG